MDDLIFIDTNILLDFYRSKNEVSLKLLKRLEDLHKCLITTCQVEMEYKKNRQSVILESYNKLKSPDSISAPAFFSEAQNAKVLSKSIKEMEKRVAAMKKSIRQILTNPTKHDPVYKVVQRMFRDNTDFNLTREDKVRFTLRRLAFKRFMLGYPPRKNSGISIGDAINWEWIIECAKKGNYNVIIVSRDSDFGVTLGKDAYINDWLANEFRQRVSQKRKIFLTPRLTEALKKVSVHLSKEEGKVEEEMVEESIIDSSYKPSKDI